MSTQGIPITRIYDYNTHYRIVCDLYPVVMDDEVINKIKKTKEKNKNNPLQNNFKFENSISRTKSQIYEYACCNEWEYFVTITIKDKYGRYDLDDFRQKFTQWLRDNYNKKGQKIQWLFIPEKHKDGGWHMHGLINGLQEGKDLQEFTTNMHLPYSILDRIKQGVKVYNWPAYADKFGYCTCEPIKNIDAVCKYITKYICKDLSETIQEVGKHMYYCSRGLNKSKLLEVGSIRTDKTVLWDFKNDYVFIKSIPKDLITEEEVRALINYA